MSAAELAARARTVAAETNSHMEIIAEVVAELADITALNESAATTAITAIDALHINRDGAGEELEHCYHCLWSWPCPTRQALGLP